MVCPIPQGNHNEHHTFSLKLTTKFSKNYSTIILTRSSIKNNSCLQQVVALGQCIPPPRHILPVSLYGSGSVSRSVVWIETKIKSFVHWSIVNLPWRFHGNLFRRFRTKLITDKQTDKQRQKHITPLADVIRTASPERVTYFSNFSLFRSLWIAEDGTNSLRRLSGLMHYQHHHHKRVHRTAVLQCRACTVTFLYSSSKKLCNCANYLLVPALY